jgi:hypothetical protein
VAKKQLLTDEDLKVLSDTLALIPLDKPEHERLLATIKKLEKIKAAPDDVPATKPQLPDFKTLSREDVRNAVTTLGSKLAAAGADLLVRATTPFQDVISDDIEGFLDAEKKLSDAGKILFFGTSTPFH